MAFGLLDHEEEFILKLKNDNKVFKNALEEIAGWETNYDDEDKKRHLRSIIDRCKILAQDALDNAK